MNAKAVIPLVAGLGIAGLAAKLGFDYVKKAQGSPAKSVELWATIEDVPRGSSIEEPMLTALKFPQELAPANALTDKKAIVGRVPHTGVPAGVPVLESMLLPPGTHPGVHVPPGLRAVAVKVDESSGVDNHLDPGCRVDVVGHFTVKYSNGKSETVAKTILENVEVAAVGQRLAADTPKADAKDKKSSSSGSSDKPARAVTLLVKPDQVPVLLMAERKGDIKLSMRGTDDSSFAARTNPYREKELTDGPDLSDDAKPANGALGDALSKFMDGFNNKKEPKKDTPKSEPETVEQPATPQYVSTMTIYLGNEKRVFGWLADQPNQPIEITSPEGNLFERPTGRPIRRGPSKPRPTSVPPAVKPETKSNTEPAPEPKPELKPEPEQEPKELIG